MVLGDDQLVLQKVSWDDKVSSLRAIAQELNIGLDSIVFVDDSPFEAQGIRERLPEVTVFDVPRDPFAYPALVRQIGELFADGTAGAGKTDQYRLRALAAAERAHHATEEEYLRSLQLVVDIAVDERDALKRISELTQKSNQFNLTTRRYGEAEIAAAMDDPDAAVLSLRVRDRFGDHGLVGVLVLRFAARAAEVEAYLMSCRVLGRGVERSCWSAVAELAAAHGADELRAAYLPTAKNAQVAEFYDGLGLARASETPEGVRYASPLADLSLEPPEHIETHVHH
jgi:FkbH-like protein